MWRGIGPFVSRAGLSVPGHNRKDKREGRTQEFCRRANGMGRNRQPAIRFSAVDDAQDVAIRVLEPGVAHRPENVHVALMLFVAMRVVVLALYRERVLAIELSV